MACCSFGQQTWATAECCTQSSTESNTCFWMKKGVRGIDKDWHGPWKCGQSGCTVKHMKEMGVYCTVLP